MADQPTPDAPPIDPIADLTAQVDDLTAQLAGAHARVRYVEGEYRTLQQAVGVAANTLLASNHPLA